MDNQQSTWDLKTIVFPTLAISFFLFICWVIFRADQGQPTFLTDTIRQFKYGDKAGHLILYGVLALLVNLALSNKRIRLFSFSLLMGSVLVTSFAILEEFTQIALASRSFELYDIVCDVIGIGVFSYLSLWIGRNNSRKI